MRASECKAGSGWKADLGLCTAASQMKSEPPCEAMTHHGASPSLLNKDLT